jgi:tripartite-type tricarboxylate transporter receptor subunit TctC
MLRKIAAFILSFAMVGALSACSGGSSGGGAADSGVNWPRNVEIVVPAGAGGDTDYNARMLAAELSEKLPPNFVVANVNGNGGATGTRQVKDAANDGSSVVFFHSAFIVNELSGTTDYGFDAFEFACIAAMNPGNSVTVSSSLGVNTLQELYDYSKAHPGELKMAAQTGATSYAVSILMKQAGFDVNIVDAGSAADRLAALLGGHVDVILAGYGSVKDYVAEGELVALSMDGGVDLEAANLKSIVSDGYDVQLPFYYFFAFPKGTDAALIAEFNAAVEDIVKNNTEYAQGIYDSYYQQPTYFGREEGLAKFQEVYGILENVDFAA